MTVGSARQERANRPGMRSSWAVGMGTVGDAVQDHDARGVVEPHDHPGRKSGRCRALITRAAPPPRRVIGGQGIADASDGRKAPRPVRALWRALRPVALGTAAEKCQLVTSTVMVITQWFLPFARS